MEHLSASCDHDLAEHLLLVLTPSTRPIDAKPLSHSRGVLRIHHHLDLIRTRPDIAFLHKRKDRLREEKVRLLPVALSEFRTFLEVNILTSHVGYESNVTIQPSLRIQICNLTANDAPNEIHAKEVRLSYVLACCVAHRKAFQHRLTSSRLAPSCILDGKPEIEDRPATRGGRQMTPRRLEPKINRNPRTEEPSANRFGTGRPKERSHRTREEC